MRQATVSIALIVVIALLALGTDAVGLRFDGDYSKGVSRRLPLYARFLGNHQLILMREILTDVICLLIAGFGSC